MSYWIAVTWCGKTRIAAGPYKDRTNARKAMRLWNATKRPVDCGAHIVSELDAFRYLHVRYARD